MWSAWLAPYYEQTNLANAMWILPEGGHWDDGTQGVVGLQRRLGVSVSRLCQRQD